MALDKKPDAIGFAALDSQAAIPLLQKAKDAGIPVIAFDSGVDSDIPLTTAATDNVAAALAADKMAELIGIGYETVKAAVAAIKGEKVEKNIDTGFYWYDKTNLDDEKIKAVRYE